MLTSLFCYMEGPLARDSHNVIGLVFLFYFYMDFYRVLVVSRVLHDVRVLSRRLRFVPDRPFTEMQNKTENNVSNDDLQYIFSHHTVSDKNGMFEHRGGPEKLSFLFCFLFFYFSGFVFVGVLVDIPRLIHR